MAIGKALGKFVTLAPEVKPTSPVVWICKFSKGLPKEIVFECEGNIDPLVEKELPLQPIISCPDSPLGGFRYELFTKLWKLCNY